jgi:hypothetical protein
MNADVDTIGEWKMGLVREIVIAFAANAELTKMNVTAEAAAHAACDTTEALWTEVEKRGWNR